MVAGIPGKLSLNYSYGLNIHQSEIHSFRYVLRPEIMLHFTGILILSSIPDPWECGFVHKDTPIHEERRE
ncbi:MAG: hypothetical protein CMF59_11320 [Leptospiraceae bacterium]|nr:hypothetical protein [Leptospiraceae bacterium]